MMRTVHLLGICVLLLGSTALGHANDTEEGIAFFESKIRPVLVQHCYACHAADAKNIKGGLLLDSKLGARSGGESGAAVIPHNSGESLLLSAIRYEDFEMPPKQQLPEAVIADFEKWIAMGAPDPREGQLAIRREIDMEEGRRFWAFQPVVRPTVPSVDSAWPHHDIDRFVLARMQDVELAPVDDAERANWLRRVTFDLIGLLPSVQELDDFLADASGHAKEVVVDRLLNSEHFGERWGRHWLDLARYAESTGRTRNYPFPFAWRYRDYVIKSFNEDKPYDQFLVEQIAGDLLSADDEGQREEQLIATGYLALGSPDLNERDETVFQMDMIADQIDTISRSLLGLTVGCARCHDHKFDPIPTQDYYALAGIFKSTQLLNGYASRVGGGNQARPDLLIALGDKRTKPVVKQLTEEEELVAGLNEKQATRLLKAKQLRDHARSKVVEIRQAKDLDQQRRENQLAAAKKDLAKKTQQFNQLRNRLNRNRQIKVEGPACMGVRDANQIVNCKIHIRGDTHKLGNEVPRGFLQVVAAAEAELPEAQSGRLQLADWIASPEHPLTARVFVNRVWRHLFGRGLVRTVDNFGAMGAEPTHPELLDYLASEFMANGWSVKQLVRQLVLTRTYGLDVTYNAHNATIDGDNRYLWRMNSRRLDYEAIRDAILTVSGELQTTPPTGSPVEGLPIGELSRQKIEFKETEFFHRSIYLPVMRNLLPEEAVAFDFPDASETRGARNTTTVPTQSLYLMNSPFVRQQSGLAARKLLADSKSATDISSIQAAYARVFARSPTSEETSRVIAYIQSRMDDLAADTIDKYPGEDAWAEVFHAMFASAEFRYR